MFAVPGRASTVSREPFSLESSSSFGGSFFLVWSLHGAVLSGVGPPKGVPLMDSISTGVAWSVWFAAARIATKAEPEAVAERDSDRERLIRRKPGAPAPLWSVLGDVCRAKVSDLLRERSDRQTAPEATSRDSVLCAHILWSTPHRGEATTSLPHRVHCASCKMAVQQTHKKKC